MAEEECEECPPAGAPAWMATFADLSTLLLTFFVLLLSFANMDIIKFESMSGSLKDAFHVPSILHRGDMVFASGNKTVANVGIPGESGDVHHTAPHCFELLVADVAS